MDYEISFHPEALKEFCALDGSLKLLVKKQLEKLKNHLFSAKNLGIKADMI